MFIWPLPQSSFSILIYVCTALDQSRENRNGPTQPDDAVGTICAQTCQLKKLLGLTAQFMLHRWALAEKHDYTAEKETMKKWDEESTSM